MNAPKENPMNANLVKLAVLTLAALALLGVLAPAAQAGKTKPVSGVGTSLPICLMSCSSSTT